MPSALIEPVLLVEDKRPILTLLTGLLQEAGIGHVDAVWSGAEALRKLQSQSYALVLCERYMHPISGIDLKGLMSARRDWARIPFICVVSSEREGDARKRSDAGLAHCVGIPVTAQELRAAIDAARQARAA